MVATISVLVGGASGAAAYYTATGGYYDAERTGRWFGQATAQLGLSGEVDRRDFEMLLAGHAPSGERLARKVPVKSSKTETQTEQSRPSCDPKEQSDKPKKKRAEYVPGYDVCFSAPKSVSLLWAIGSQDVRSKVETCMYEAVSKTLKDMESLLPLARRGRNGTQETSAKLAAAMFLHTTSRELDPQLHIHSVLPNLCHGDDGRWGGINSRMLHSWTPAMGRVFRCHLGKALIEKLNVKLERPKREDGKLESWFEIKGVKKKVIKEFSRRREAIVKATPRDQITDSRARAKVSKETRPEKVKDADLRSLMEYWEGQADSHGFTRKHVERICSKRNKPIQLSAESLHDVIEEAIQSVGREKAYFRDWNVVSQVCESLQHHGVDATSIVPEVMKQLRESPSAIPLGNNPRQEYFSTEKNWQVESELLADIDTMKKTQGAVVPSQSVAKLCGKYQQKRSKPFSDEQKKAVEKLLSDESSIRIMTGVAGSGKSVTLDVVREGLERQGYQVLGGALAGTAAQGLAEKTKVPARTVASYLYHLERTLPQRIAKRVAYDVGMMIRALQGKPTYYYKPVKIPKKSVLIVDEAGMLDTKTLSRLIHQVKKAEATLILVGDTNQLPPIQAGGPMDRAATKLGRARLSTNHRQQDRDDRKAVSDLRAGKVKESLENYKTRDRLTIARSHGETIQKVVQAWKEQGGIKKPKEHIVLTQTRADAQELNERCQKERLANRSIRGLGVKHGKTTYYRRDRVMFHLPMRKYGIENGFTGTITAVDLIRRQVTVRLDQKPPNQRRSKTNRDPSLVTLPLGKIDHSSISLGYAATTHKLQGATVDHALVLLGGPMLSRELAYTQLTRARKSTRIFASRDQVGKDLELLIKGMSRSAKKDLAHDMADRLGGPALKPTPSQRPTLDH